MKQSKHFEIASAAPHNDVFTFNCVTANYQVEFDQRDQSIFERAKAELIETHYN